MGIHKLKLGVAGCTGRMGLALISAIQAAEGCTLFMGSERPGCNEKKVREALAAAGAAKLALTDSPKELFARTDAVIDFTSPESTVALARASSGKVLVIGTTGLSAAEQRAVEQAAKKARIVWSANFSMGVNVLAALVEQAAALLADDYDIEIDEMHHALKKDAPSGTALMLGRAAARGRKIDFKKGRVHYGEGTIGARKRGTIGFSVKRGGEVVGVHTVTLAGGGENMELTHRAFSRAIYARGAVKAALWAADQKPGLYSMKDVLGI